MKYIDADKLLGKINKIIERVQKNTDPSKVGTINDTVAIAGISTLIRVKSLIEEMQQEDNTPPSIEEESNKKGWLHYGLMVSEIGLHRYNAIHRMAEHKEKFDAQAVPELYHVAEYYKAVGVEIVCCCLQGYSKDFFFSPEEVMNILKNEEKL